MGFFWSECIGCSSAARLGNLVFGHLICVGKETGERFPRVRDDRVTTYDLGVRVYLKHCLRVNLKRYTPLPALSSYS
jgi:hypothetical protein